MEDKTVQLSSKILSEREIRRYDLQIANTSLGLAGQEKLKQSKVLVIGAGGKGTSILQNLATVGVGKLGISDNYHVKEDSLSRQYLYGNTDLGKQKAIVSKQKLHEINHLVKYELHNVYLNEKNILPICEPYDILVDATDNFPARYLIHKASIELDKPLIFSRTLSGEGLVSVFNYMNGPSLKCLYPSTVAKDVEDEKIFSCHVALMSMLGAIVANEVIKVILGMETVLSGNLLTINTRDYSFTQSPIQKNSENFNK